MSTTRDDLISRDGFAYQWVLAIEGYEHLITDGPTAAVLTAWAGTAWDYADDGPAGPVIGGLAVNCDFDQGLEPFDAFSSARSMQFSVMDVTDLDTFGIDVARPAYGAKTWLAVGVDANDTTLTVKDTTAFTSSGSLYIGTERIVYTGKTATTFTGCTRGKYSPFNRDGVTTNEFGRAHSIPSWDFNVQIQPLVTQYPQTFIGRWVGLWMHRKRAGVLDTKAEALLVYAGKIGDIRDSGNGITTVSCTDIMEIAKESPILSDQFEARIREGIYMLAEETIGFRIFIDGTGEAYYSDNFNEQRFTLPEFVAEMNRVASQLRTVSATTEISFALVRTDAGWRVESACKNTTAGSKHCAVTVNMPERALEFIGWDPGDPVGENTDEGINSSARVGTFTSHATKTYYQAGSHEPLRVIDSGSRPNMNPNSLTGAPYVYYDSTRGTFIDQTDYLPQGVVTSLQSSLTNLGLFLVAGRLMVGRHDAGSSRISRLTPLSGFMDTKENEANKLLTSAGRLFYSTKPEDLVIKQVVALEGSLRELFVGLLCGTSIPGYNHATHDVFGGQLGAGIPYEPIASAYESISRIDGATHGGGLIVFIDKPTTFKELFNADMILRQAFTIWHNGSMRIARWAVPRAAKAVASLTEGNKAGQAGDPQRTVTERTDRHIRNTIKIEYNRVAGKDTYESSFQFVDAQAIESYGVERAVTVKARNSYGDYATTGDSVKALAPNLLSVLPMFSRPRFECRRTVDFTLYEKLYPGAVVKVTDNFMRDPSTGLRGVTERAAIVLRLRYDFGGWEFDSSDARPMYGEVDLLFFDTDEAKALGASAVVDTSFSSGGYTNGWDGASTLRTVAREFAASDESVDHASIAVGDEVSVIEINPDDPAAALSWNGTVTYSTSQYIALDIVLTGFIVGREYKIVPQGYSTSIAAQKAAYTYLADTTNLVDATRDAYTFGEDDDSRATLSLSTAAAYETGGKIAESAVANADGPPMDVATMDEFARAINHLCDARLTTIGGNLRASGVVGSIFTFPINITQGSISGRMTRSITISAMCANASASTVRYIFFAVSDTPPYQTTKGGAHSSTTPRFHGKSKVSTGVAIQTSSGTVSRSYVPDISNIVDDGLLWVTVWSQTDVTVYGISEINYGVRS